MFGADGIKLILTVGIVLIIVGLVFISVGIRMGAGNDETFTVHLDIRHLLGILAAAFAFALLLMTAKSGSPARMPDKWQTEVKVTDKSTVSRRDKNGQGEEVFLFECEDEEGGSYTFEITDASLEGRFEAAAVSRQIQLNRYYKLTVGWYDKNDIDKMDHYPTILSAKKLDGFTPGGQTGWEELDQVGE